MYSDMQLSEILSRAKLAQIRMDASSITHRLNKPRILTASLDNDFTLDKSDGQYDSYFLIAGDEINGNKWGVTEESIPKNIESAVGKPFVVTSNKFIENSPYGEKFMHPNMLHFLKHKPQAVTGLDPENFEDNLKFQEPYHVGIMEKVFFDESKMAWKTILKRDPKFAGMQMPPFCSIAIFQEDMNEPAGQITKWKVSHLCGLTERPAFGDQAIYTGTCTGTIRACEKSLAGTKSLLSTDMKFAKEQIAALISTDNTETQAVPIYGIRKTLNKKFKAL